MVLRFFAFRLTPPEDYRASEDFDQFLAQTMRRINRLEASAREELATSFLDAMRTAEAIFGWHAFRKWYPGQTRRSPVNKALFESVAVNLAGLADQQRQALVESRDTVVEYYQELMMDQEFERAVSFSTGARARVITRFSKIRHLFSSVLQQAGSAEQ
jgi:hypothetical protein